MFTGLVERVGLVSAIRRVESGYGLWVTTPLAAEVAVGESVAVNGVCLTVTQADATAMHADIGPETARRTTLGSLRPGQSVNLERAMRADARFGGHFVQGHVDATGTLVAIREEGGSRCLTISYPSELAPLFVRKGSVAVDGISLTVADLGPESFDVMIVPFTWAHTHLGSVRKDDRVNLECDMVGKYVARAVDVHRATLEGRSHTSGMGPTS